MPTTQVRRRCRELSLSTHARDYLLWNRGHAPNQYLADVLAAQLADCAACHAVAREPPVTISYAPGIFSKQAIDILGQPSDDGRGHGPWKPPPVARPDNSNGGVLVLETGH